SRVTRALEDGRFELYYQPIVPIGDVDDHRGHYELLLRMRDEGGALVPPDAFIPAAERYNLMPTLDRWVIRQALEGLVDSGRSGDDGGYSLAINLSGTSLNDDKFLAFVLHELESHKLAPGALCFEITETAAISNLSVAAHFMSEIKRRGCEFSLDDFGSGLSSFTYLKNLPVDYLKIDGHFIKQITADRIDQAMVKAITQVGSAMGIRTVAEHVESKEVLDTLRAIGVEYAQGYYFAEPAPVADFRRLANGGASRLADTGTSPGLRLV
ncbi:MAG: EAL domain-containing protein, partial [Gammaproteobacteria bacterium]